MIEQSQIQKLIDLPIEGVAERLGLKVKRHFSLCPFHDDHHNSLHYNRVKNRYRCYVCGAHGRTIDLVMNKEGMKFRDACQWLADDANVILEAYTTKVKKEPKAPIVNIDSLLQLVAEPVLTEEARHFLFDERKLDPRVIRWCGISSTHTHLLIPYFDADGSLQSIQWRYLGKYANPQLPDEPRFHFPKGSQCSIYGLQILKLLKLSEPLYITEGCSDCWSMLSAGHKAIAIPSATLLKPTDFAPIRELGLRLGLKMKIYPDNDAPGERLFLQLRELTLRLGLTLTRLQLPEGCKDYSDYYIKQKCENVNL